MHGLQAPQPGCSHFFTAVDEGRPLEVAIRWSQWGVPYLLCPDCQAQVNVARGTSDPEIRSDSGLDYLGARCSLHVLEWCERFGPNPALLAWMRRRYLDEAG